MRQLEPFTELLNRNQNWKLRLRRLKGRGPFARRAFAPTSAIKDRILPNLNTGLLTTKHELDQTGYSGNFMLSKELLESLMNDIEGKPFVNRAKRSQEVAIDLRNPENPSDAHIYSIIDPHMGSEAIRSLIKTDLQPVAESYLGPESCLLNSQIWITFPGATSETHKDFGWHYDVDDFKFLKFFCYLSDVDIDCGPHSIVPGSHMSRHAYRFFNRQVDDQTVKKFGDPVTITGDAGSCFFEDTIIYHKGAAPISKHRIILQVQFGVSK